MRMGNLNFTTRNELLRLPQACRGPDGVPAVARIAAGTPSPRDDSWLVGNIDRNCGRWRLVKGVRPAFGALRSIPGWPTAVEGSGGPCFSATASTGSALVRKGIRIPMVASFARVWVTGD